MSQVLGDAIEPFPLVLRRGSYGHVGRTRLACPVPALALVAISSALLAQDVNELYHGFQDPPREYSPMPYWFWNGEVRAAEVRRQIELMQSQGVHQAIVFPWDGMRPPYFTEGFWKVLGEALQIARERGFTPTWPMSTTGQARTSGHRRETIPS